MVASNLSEILEINIPCSPTTLILNDLLRTELTLVKKQALLAGLTATRRLITIHWKPPHALSLQVWLLTYSDFVYLELLTARVHGAEEETIEMWQLPSVNLKNLAA